MNNRLSAILLSGLNRLAAILLCGLKLLVWVYLSAAFLYISTLFFLYCSCVFQEQGNAMILRRIEGPPSFLATFFFFTIPSAFFIFIAGGVYLLFARKRRLISAGIVAVIGSFFAYGITYGIMDYLVSDFQVSLTPTSSFPFIRFLCGVFANAAFMIFLGKRFGLICVKEKNCEKSEEKREDSSLPRRDDDTKKISGENEASLSAGQESPQE